MNSTNDLQEKDFSGVCEVRTHAEALKQRAPQPDLAPDDMILWAALQSANGGTWTGCVNDADGIARAQAAGGRKA